MNVIRTETEHKVEYHLDGKLHREDGPAIVTADGYEAWYMYGKLHREGGPAVSRKDGYQVWYRWGSYHREDGPAIVWPDGTQEYRVYGKIHREDGPAIIEADGRMAWYRYDKLHREDGPAIECPGGKREWWVDGVLQPHGGKESSPMVYVKILSDNACVPTRGTSGSAGIDLYSDSDVTVYHNQRVLITTGISIAIPEGYVGIIKSRSSLALYSGLDVEAGVIDSDYRGPIGVLVHNRSEDPAPRQIIAGDRIAQMLIVPYAASEVAVVSNLPDTDRVGGWGSTGR